MADLQFYEMDTDELSSDSGDELSFSPGSDGYDSDPSNPDSVLSPLQRLEKYIQSEHTYTRQIVAKNILETLKLVEPSGDSRQVFIALEKLSLDSDGSIRNNVIEQLFAFVSFCRTSSKEDFSQLVSTIILPILSRGLKDNNIQVRKTTHTTLISLLEEKFITPEDIEERIAPVIIELADADNIDDLRTEAVTTMTRLSPLVGKDITERVFLKRFSEMCTDAVFHVRKVCATYFGDMAHVLGTEITETILLPKYFYLCEDGVWGVRNACTECFMQVSLACSMQTRRDELAPLFVNLICDQSRWVRMAAFQALGGFISTFADSSITGLQLTPNGTLITVPITEKIPPSPRKIAPKCDESSYNPKTPPTTPSESVTEFGSSVDEHENEFNSFLFWRNFPPSLELVCNRLNAIKIDEAQLVETPANKALPSELCNDQLNANNIDIFELSNESTNKMNMIDIENEVKTDRIVQLLNLEARTVLSDDSSCEEIKASSLNEDDFEEIKINSLNISNVLKDEKQLVTVLTDKDKRQQIVPNDLLEYYLGMIDSSRAQTVDTEIMRHCAYSLPAVAYALGPQNWFYLKELMDVLARDMQWKVRRTLAFSIHQLAQILGHEATVRDLLPIFDEFLKDLDEVRVGVLKHLAEFLALLDMDVRQQYLPRISDFLATDNLRNWRFRMDLAQQLELLTDIFSPTDVVEHLASIALTLADDKVAQVRLASIPVLAQIIGKLSIDVCSHLWTNFVEEVKSRFYLSNQFSRRQLYVYLCGELLKKKCLSPVCFNQVFIPTLLNLSKDAVPNVRIALAQCFITHIYKNETLMNANNNVESKDIENIGIFLRNDRDKDVLTFMKDQIDEFAN